nr:unnamed protein product [Digitaria exilis]
MDAVFHVTDQIGRKLTDPSLPEFIQRALVPLHRLGTGRSPPPKFTTCLGNVVGPGGPDVSDCAALEFTVHDRPGLLSSITSVLADNGCHVASGQAWTHNGRAAGVLYVTATAGGATPHPSRWARIERLVNAVVDARENVTGERRWVCMSEPVQGRVHTERRLHQLMHDDRDYESGPAPTPVDEGLFSMGDKAATALLMARRVETRVSIDSWEERGYAVVKMTSRDRPRLLFDTVCALTDMHYVVFHATVGSQGSLAIQEYYIRHKDGRTVDSNAERQKVSRCLVAAVERRATHVRLDHYSSPSLYSAAAGAVHEDGSLTHGVAHWRVVQGMMVEVRAADRSGLLSDFTRVLREHGLSLLRVELKRHKDEAIGIFYLVTDTGGEVRTEAVRAVQVRVAEMDISLDIVREAPGWPPVRKTSVPAPPVAGQLAAQERPRPSLGSLLWSHLGKLSNNLSYIRS